MIITRWENIVKKSFRQFLRFSVTTECISCQKTEIVEKLRNFSLEKTDIFIVEKDKKSRKDHAFRDLGK